MWATYRVSALQHTTTLVYREAVVIGEMRLTHKMSGRAYTQAAPANSHFLYGVLELSSI